MKNILTISIVFAFSFYAQSQNCTPDTTLADSLAPIHPAPLLSGDTTGGIDVPACIGEPYEFVFNIIVPDTVHIPVGGDTLALNLIRASISPTGAIVGLPSGVTYSCDPPDCIMEAGTRGCVVLEGTPDSTNSPGAYEMVITISLTMETFGTLPFTFPGTVAPGSYSIELLPENDPRCVVGVQEVKKNPLNIHPTISRGEFFIEKSSPGARINVMDLQGRSVNFTHSGDRIYLHQPGQYFIIVYDENQILTGRVSVIR